METKREFSVVDLQEMFEDISRILFSAGPYAEGSELLRAFEKSKDGSLLATRLISYYIDKHGSSKDQIQKYQLLLNDISTALAPVSEEFNYQRNNPDKYEYRTRPVTVSFEQAQKLAEVNAAVKLVLMDSSNIKKCFHLKDQRRTDKYTQSGRTVKEVVVCLECNQVISTMNPDKSV